MREEDHVPIGVETNEETHGGLESIDTLERIDEKWTAITEEEEKRAWLVNMRRKPIRRHVGMIKCSVCDNYKPRREMFKMYPALNKYWCSRECLVEEEGWPYPTDFGGGKESACKVIYKHGNDPYVEGDSEALGVEFIEDFVGIHCEKLEKEKVKDSG